MYKKIIIILLILVSGISLVSAANPVAYYKFMNTGPGGDTLTNVIDYTGNGHTGFGYNTSYIKGILGYGVEFNDIYSYITINDHTVFTF